MSLASNDVEKGQRSSTFQRHKKLLIIVGIMVAICTLGLGLGLGLGLHPKPTSSSIQTPTATPSGTVFPTPTATGTTWQPAVNESFNYQLSVLPQSSDPHGISVWFIDLFAATTEVITGLQGNGAKVVCYFSAGSSETWRPDFKQFKDGDLGDDLKGWAGEKWLNTKSETVRSIMRARFDQAAQKKCDGVDPDNMDAYDNDGGGLGLTEDDAVDYAKFLASEASSRGMSIGLKNAAKIIPQVIDVMQWSVNEQCAQFKECDTFSGFIKAGKPVFNIEYPKGDDTNNDDAVSSDQLNEKCNQQENKAEGFSTILKNMNLNTWIEFCNGTSAVLT